MTKQLILASKSPRRQQLLRHLNIDFIVKTKQVDESVITVKDPAQRVEQLAILKGKKRGIKDNEVVLSADTVVAFEGEIFGKPTSTQEAYEMISTLSGKTHEVFTGVSLRSKEEQISFVERTAVTWWELSEGMIQWYINTEEPYDKAGAYGIQELGAVLVKEIKGDYFNVVGLPISRVVRKLMTFGINPFDH